MFCPKCGANNENNSSFCSSCGAALPKAPAADGNQSEQQSGYTDFNNIPHPEPTQQPALTVSIASSRDQLLWLSFCPLLLAVSTEFTG